MTEWRIIPGFSAYELSPDGVIRRRVKARTRKVGHLPTIGRNNYGYLRAKLVDDSGIKRTVTLHRLIALAFHGPPPSEKHQARHLDDDKSNNHPSNIAWGTSKENHADARRNGTRDPRGEGNPRAKLTAEQVIAFRARYRAGAPIVALARESGMSTSAMGDMLRGAHWSDVAP